jgi:hypothetical protein
MNTQCPSADHNNPQFDCPDDSICCICDAVLPQNPVEGSHAWNGFCSAECAAATSQNVTPPWVIICKRTEDPKLATIERIFAQAGIPSRRNGESWHAPIL